MIKHTRRTWIQKNIAFTAGTSAALGMSLMKAPDAAAQNASTERRGTSN